MPRKNCEEKKYSYNHPGIGMGPFEIDACSINDAKEKYKKNLNIKRLPNGFQIWKVPKKHDLGDTNIND